MATMSLLTLAPGVRSFLDVGGNQMVENPNARAFGQGGEMWSTLEGIATQPVGPAAAAALLGLSNGRRGARPDPRHRCGVPTRGVQINAIVKSGGNDFHGGGFWAQTDQHFQSNNIDDELRALGITSGNALDEAVRRQRGPGRPHHSEQAVVLRGGAPALQRDRRC